MAQERAAIWEHHREEGESILTGAAFYKDSFRDGLEREQERHGWRQNEPKNWKEPEDTAKVSMRWGRAIQSEAQRS